MLSTLPTCRRCAEGAGHGPYWYGFRRQRGRVQSKYFGKDRPYRYVEPMNYEAALRLFEFHRLPSSPTARQIQRRFLELAKDHHPDKGGDTEAMQRINAAREMVQRRHGGAGS